MPRGWPDGSGVTGSIPSISCWPSSATPSAWPRPPSASRGSRSRPSAAGSRRPSDPGAGHTGAGAGLRARPAPIPKPVTLVLGLAAREARELEQDRVGTEHLLLGLAGEGEGGGAHVLEEGGGGPLRL